MTVSRSCVPLAAALALFAALPGCAPPPESPGTDAAYAASERRGTGEVVDDNKIEIALNKLLADDSAALWKDVSTVVYHGRVLLLGSVETAGAKVRAGAIGGQPEGVIEVINDIQVTEAGGGGGVLNDAAIEKSIHVKYLLAEDIDSANLRVRSVNGTVYLIGQVETWADLGRVREIARATGDVVKVVDYLRVTEAAGSCGCEKRHAPKQKPKP
jgi:osmotically-inducible protein OsmY